MTRNKLTAYLGIAVALVTLTGGSLFTWWHHIGWETPAGHDESLNSVEAAHEGSNTAIMSALTAISTKQDLHHDQWQCDEWAETLDDLTATLVRQERLDQPTLSIQHEIEDLRQMQDSRQCERFEDFD